MANGIDPYIPTALGLYDYSIQALYIAVSNRAVLETGYLYYGQVSYPWYGLYPTLIAACHCSNLTPFASKREPYPTVRWPTILSLQAAFLARGFTIWASMELIQPLLIVLIGNYPPAHFARFILTILFAPFKLSWIWSIMSNDYLPYGTLVRSLGNIRLPSWVQYITALLACHSVEVLLPLVVDQVLSICDIHDGVEVDSLMLLFKQLIYFQAQSMAAFLKWVLVTVATTQAALMVPSQEMKFAYRDERGLWSAIYVSITSMKFSLWGRFILHSWTGTAAILSILGIRVLAYLLVDLMEK